MSVILSGGGGLHASQVTILAGESASRGGVCIQGAGSASRGRGLHPGGLASPLPWDTTGYSKQAGGTHPTGMHYCLISFRKLNIMIF